MPVREILPDLFFIQRGFLSGNHFAYRSDNPVLIDTAYKSGLAETLSLIAGAGIDISRTSLIINTHCHCDHIGGNRKIQDISNCRVAMSRIGKHFIDSKDDWSTWWKYYAQEADFFSCSTALDDGDTIMVGPYEFQCIYTPGHASDGIVLYQPENRALISSDTLWEYDMAVMTVRIEGSRALFCMMESVERIARLPVDVVYPGHGAAFTDFEGAIHRARSRLSRFIQDPRSVGRDLIKKIMVYTLMMKTAIDSSEFLEHLMRTHWYPETVNLYFSGEHKNTYNEILNDLIDRGIVYQKDGQLLTSITP